MAEFLLEAANMCSVDHAHIVQLYGVVLSADSLMLVSGFTIVLTAFLYCSLHVFQQSDPSQIKPILSQHCSTLFNFCCLSVKGKVRKQSVTISRYVICEI